MISETGRRKSVSLVNKTNTAPPVATCRPGMIMIPRAASRSGSAPAPCPLPATCSRATLVPVCSAAKSHRQQIELGRIGPAGGGFHVSDAGKIAFELSEQRCLRAALKDFGEKCAAWCQHLACEVGGRLGERHGLEVIGAPVAGRIRSHVGEH